MPSGGKGEDRKTISISRCRVMMIERFLLHVLVQPIGIWGVLMEWNQEIRHPRQKLGIGTAGNAGPANPAINALVQVTDGIVGRNSIGEVQKGLVNRGAIAEIPAPTYGYIRKDDFYVGPLGDNLLNEWDPYALRGMIYTDKVGRCMSPDTFIRQILWECLEDICACRWRRRYTMGVVFKDGPWGKLDELQIDTVALKRGMLMEENAKAECTEEKRSHNGRLIRRADARWEVCRTEEADTRKRPLITYGEWVEIEGRLRNSPLEEQEGAVSRWRLWEIRPTEEKWRWLKELGCYSKQGPVRPSTEERGLTNL